MRLDDPQKEHIRVEVETAHQTALHYRTGYKRFDYRFKLRNEILRIVDFVNDSEFYKMREIKYEFEEIAGKAKKNEWPVSVFLDELCDLVLEYAQEYREEQIE